MKQTADPGVLTNPGMGVDTGMGVDPDISIGPGMGVDPDISIGPGMSVDPGALACLHPSMDCRTAVAARLSTDLSMSTERKEGGLNTLPGVRAKQRAGCCFDVRV